MLDVVHEVAPLIQNKFQDESEQYQGVMMIVIGFRLAFHARLLTFFWEKIFHGEEDLITEPNARLIEDSWADDDWQQDRQESDVHLQEII